MEQTGRQGEDGMIDLKLGYLESSCGLETRIVYLLERMGQDRASDIGWQVSEWRLSEVGRLRWAKVVWVQLRLKVVGGGGGWGGGGKSLCTAERRAANFRTTSCSAAKRRGARSRANWSRRSGQGGGAVTNRVQEQRSRSRSRSSSQRRS